MTRGDYIMIARVLRQTPVGQTNREDLARAFAQRLREDNERFDAESFIDAATGITPVNSILMREEEVSNA